MTPQERRRAVQRLHPGQVRRALLWVAETDPRLVDEALHREQTPEPGVPGQLDLPC